MCMNRYSPALAICDLPDDDECTDPFAVSLVSSNCSTPLNLLHLFDLRQASRDHQQTRRSYWPFKPAYKSEHGERKKPVNFTICVKPVHSNYSNVNQLVEFIEISRILGAERFVIYVLSATDVLESCLELYVQRRLVELVPWDLVPSDVVMWNQYLAMNDCIYRTMYTTKYQLTIDFDEVIFPFNANNWLDMLGSIEESILAKNISIDRITSYNFRNVFFPLQGPNDSTFADNALVQRYQINSLLKTSACNDIFPWKMRSKVIIRPERVTLCSGHMIRENAKLRKNDINFMVSANDALMFQYREWSCRLDDKPRLRSHDFSDRIIARIGSSPCHLDRTSVVIS